MHPSHDVAKRHITRSSLCSSGGLLNADPIRSLWRPRTAGDGGQRRGVLMTSACCSIPG
ncbi:unnamed protein product, partial [Musa acuminata subsp. malaccensis]